MWGTRALPFMSALPMDKEVWVADLQLRFQLCGIVQEAGQKVQRRRSKLHEGPLLKVPVLDELPETVDLSSMFERLCMMGLSGDRRAIACRVLRGIRAHNCHIV